MVKEKEDDDVGGGTAVGLAGRAKAGRLGRFTRLGPGFIRETRSEVGLGGKERLNSVVLDIEEIAER